MFPEAITIHYTELLLQQQIWIDFYAHITIRWSQFLSCVCLIILLPSSKHPFCCCLFCLLQMKYATAQVDHYECNCSV